MFDGINRLLIIEREFFYVFCKKKLANQSMNNTYIFSKVKRVGFLIFSLFVSLVEAQELDLKFENLTVADGLSQANAMAMVQDDLGFVWVGTRDGLNRYDGYTFEVFKNDPEDSTSISNNEIKCMALDADGNLWAGTQNGLNFYNPQTKRFKRYHNSEEPGSIIGDNINALFTDSKNRLWVGTASGLSMFENGEISSWTTSSSALPNNYVTAITEGSQGTIWVGTQEGLAEVNPERMTFTNYYHDETDDRTLSSSYISVLLFDNSNNLWVGTFDNGICKMPDGTRQFERFLHDPNDESSIAAPLVRSLSEDWEGRIWVGTDTGLSLYDNSNAFINYKSAVDNEFTLSSDVILSILSDREGRLWAGTMYGGVNLYDPGRFGFNHIKSSPANENSLSHNNVTDFASDNFGNLWIATDGGGLNKWNIKSHDFTHYKNNPRNRNSLTNNKLLAVLHDSQGYIWIGMWAGGLNRFDPRTGRITRFLADPDDPQSLGDDRVFDIIEDGVGDIWVCTYENGLSRFDRETETFEVFRHDPQNSQSMSPGAMIHMSRDNSGNIWVATREQGLDKFDPRTGTVTHFRSDGKEGSISENVIFCSFTDSKERLWVGTNGGGLNLYNKETKKFKVYRQKQGLPNDVINGILEDNEGFIWLSTNNGLSRFNPETEEFKNYDISDGLQNNEFNRWAFHKLPSGELAFGGTNGFNIFQPADLKENKNKPDVFINSFKLFNDPVPIAQGSILEKDIMFTDDIKLNYDQNFFSFEFIGLSYRQSEKNQYKYILENFQENWVEAGSNRNVSFTNVDPGEYTFKVLASNNDGVWSDEPVELSIVITPPFWGTWWFRLMVLVIVGFSIFWVIKWRSDQVKESKALLEQKVKEATEQMELQNQELTIQSKKLMEAIEETNYVINQAVELGNFDVRMDLDNKTGEWRAFGESVNLLFETISTPFNAINRIVNKLAKGDLTGRYQEEAKGEIKELAENLNMSLDSLSALLTEVASRVGSIGDSTEEMLTSGHEMNSSTGEISRAIAEISQGANEQVIKVDESSNIIEGILSFSKEMGTQAQSINEEAYEGVVNSDEGIGLMRQLNEAMNKVITISKNTNTAIASLISRADEISSVLNLTKEIAAQTNLLALNAAIEASQAGEYGRGFAVVAEEIRKLAEDSKKSTKEIEDLISGVQNETKSTAQLISEMDTSIQNSEEAVNLSLQAFEKLASSYNKTLEKSESIKDATSQQTKDISSVVEIIQHIVVIAEESAAATEETASSSSQLSTGMQNYTEKATNVSETVRGLIQKVDQFVLKKKHESMTEV